MIRTVSTRMAMAILLLSLAVAVWGVKYSPVLTEGMSCNDGDVMTWSGGQWACGTGGGGGSVPAGSILMIASGTCPTGFAENTTLGASRFPMGTLAANGDVGGTGGSNTFTPSGTNSAPTFTGTPFSGVINHTHNVTVNDPGHTHLTQRYPTATGASSGFTIDTSMSGTLADNTLPTKSGTTGVTAATNDPAGGVASITPQGAISAPNFTGSSADQRPSWAKVIFCEKT